MPEIEQPEASIQVPSTDTADQVDEQKADVLLKNALSSETSVDRLRPEQLDELEIAFLKSAEIQRYLKNETPIDRLGDVLEEIEGQCREKKIDEATSKQILEAAQRQLKNVIDACHDYALSVDRFERTKLARFRMEDDKFARILEQWDVTRRRAHESMLSTFRGFNRYHSAVLHKHYGIDIPNSLLIGDSIMRSRDVAGEWALASDYYLRANELIKQIKKRKEQPVEAAPRGEQAA